MIVDTVESVATKERLGQNRADEITRRVDRILRKAISQGGGSTVKGMGDGVLAIFGSASSALVAACSALQAMDAANRSMSEPVALRAGIAVGDIVFEDGDIKGLAIDEASRLQSAASSNGILVTSEVNLLARGRTNCVLLRGPELQLKGIGRPVQTFELDWSASPESTDAEVELPSKLEAVRRSRFPFAGRDRDFHDLGLPELGDASSLTLVFGPTGVGKTRLLAEWAERARRSGAFVFYRVADADENTSLEQVKEALHEFRTSLAHVRLLSSSSGYRQAWEQLVGHAQLVGKESANPSEPTSGIADFVAFLAELSSDSPTIFIIDSIQYGSGVTLDFIDELLMSLSSNIRIVCAVTSDLAAEDVTIPEAALEGRFPPSERVQYLELEPLSAEGVVEWLERQPMVTLHKPAPVELDEIGKQIAAAFFDASGGNPNVLGLVIRDSYDHERRVSMDDDGHWRAKCDLETLRRSQSAEKLVRARVARLNSDEREILDISSVVGPEIDGDLLRRVSGRDLNEIDGLLSVACARHFINDSDGIQQFETEATRRAIYRIIPSTKRADWHEAIAFALRDRASDGKTLPPDVQNRAPPERGGRGPWPACEGRSRTLPPSRSTRCPKRRRATQ